MPVPASFTLSNVTLLTFLKNRQLVVMDKSLSGHKLAKAFVMRRDDDTSEYIMLWKEGNDLKVQNTPDRPSGYSVTNSATYEFDDVAADLWLDYGDSDCPPGIVVGTGDVRHLAVTFATADNFPLPDDAADALLITCNGNYSISIFWKADFAPTSIDISEEIVFNP